MIEINVTNKRAAVIGTPVIVCGNTGYEITFDFDAEWSAAGTKYARFVYARDGKTEHKDVELTGNTVKVPKLVGIREVSVGVYAGDLQTTTSARIPCLYSILCNSGEDATTGEENPTLQAQIGDLSQLQTTAKGNLVDAINEAAKTGGTGSGSGENSSGGNSSGSGQNVNQYEFLNGLKYYALGDSITEIQGTTADPKLFGNWYTYDLQGRDLREITVSGYVQAIENRYGLVATNHGKSGHTLVADYATLSVLDYSDVALVTIAYGVNDARTGVKLGTVNSTDATTFAGALNNLLRKIYTDNPECRVLILAPLQRLHVTDFGIATPNANGNYLIDFVNMCKAIAEKRSTAFLDQYRHAGINQTNLYYYTVEGVHPVNQGFARIKNAVVGILDELFALEYEPFGTMTNTGNTEPDEPDSGGDSGDDTPPEEDTGATTVELTEELFANDGAVYDNWGSVTGKGTYKYTTPIALEMGKTYTYVGIFAADWQDKYWGATNSVDNFTDAHGKATTSQTSETVTIGGTNYKKITATIVAPSNATYYVWVNKMASVGIAEYSLSYV